MKMTVTTSGRALQERNERPILLGLAQKLSVGNPSYRNTRMVLSTEVHQCCLVSVLRLVTLDELIR
ncbi:hypothetical protein CCHR01_15335 [Colletotrichum chrysophilum]|uniref:Uncharacterized protein n=1 Tax=Colletotrichum chrysophilum TaxID=1836956 RepID=A0AAD9EBW2_9PEZI|nr:hypothetical protein CCHR01_15335 [Colletotrichum chrysophilum]